MVRKRVPRRPHSYPMLCCIFHCGALPSRMGHCVLLGTAGCRTCVALIPLAASLCLQGVGAVCAGCGCRRPAAPGSSQPAAAAAVRQPAAPRAPGQPASLLAARHQQAAGHGRCPAAQRASSSHRRRPRRAAHLARVEAAPASSRVACDVLLGLCQPDNEPAGFGCGSWRHPGRPLGPSDSQDTGAAARRQGRRRRCAFQGAGGGGSWRAGRRLCSRCDGGLLRRVRCNAMQGVHGMLVCAGVN